MRRVLLLSATIAFAAASAGQAQVKSIQNSNAKANEEAITLEPGQDPNERICKTTPPPLGSRLNAKKTCATRAQWAELEGATRADSRRAIETIQQQRVCNLNDCR